MPSHQRGLPARDGSLFGYLLGCLNLRGGVRLLHGDSPDILARSLPAYKFQFGTVYCETTFFRFVRRMVVLATGANYPAVSDAKIKASTIPLPPLAEQKRIAGILDEVDALRDKRHESIEQLDELIRSTFLDMFSDQDRWPLSLWR